MGYAINLGYVRRMRILQQYDPESTRVQSRCYTALSILEQMDIKPTVEHKSDCRRSPYRLYDPECDGRGEFGYRDCAVITWPEWVTDEILEYAYIVADTVATARGQYNRRQAGIQSPMEVARSNQMVGRGRRPQSQKSGDGK